MNNYRIVPSVLMAIASLFAVSVYGKTWHWVGGKSTGHDYGFQWWTDAANWLENAGGGTDLPQNGDTVVIDGNWKQRLTVNNSQANLKLHELRLEKTGDIIYEGQLGFDMEGAGIVSTPTSSAAVQARLDIYLRNPGWLPFTVATGGRLMTKRGIWGTGGVVKRGGGTWQFQEMDHGNATDPENPSHGYAGIFCTRVPFRLEEGTIETRSYFVMTNVAFHFAGNNTKLDLWAADYRLRDSAFGETEACTDGSHEVTAPMSFAVSNAHLRLERNLADTTFSGRFTGCAGLVWDPSDASRTFTFRRGASTSCGEIAVSNGVVRLSEGASFVNLRRLHVGGGGTFAVDADACGLMPMADATILSGGKLALAEGVTMAVASLTVGGQAIASGRYRAGEVDWLDGAGDVFVSPIGGEGARTALTWNSSASDGLVGTLGNWSGAAALPTLDDGSGFITVAGGTGMNFDVPCWLKGLDLTASSAFTFSAATGVVPTFGSEGVMFGGGAYAIDTPVCIGAPQRWNLRSGATLALNQPFKPLGSMVLRLNGTGVTYKVNGNLGPKGFQVDFEHKGTLEIAAGVTLENDIRVWNDQTDPKSAADDYYWSHPELRKKVLWKGGSPTVMNGFFHNTNTSLVVEFENNADVTFNGEYLERNGLSLTMGANSRVRFNRRFLSRGASPKIDATSVIELAAEANCFCYSNPKQTHGKGTIKTLVPYAFSDVVLPGVFEYKGSMQTDAAAYSVGQFEMSGSQILDLCGNDQSMWILYASGGTITSDTAASIRINARQVSSGINNWWSNYKATSFADKATWAGGAGLVFNGVDSTNWKRYLMAVSSTTGRLEVVNGTVVFARRAATTGETFVPQPKDTATTCARGTVDGSWLNASAVAVRGGRLTFEHSLAIGRGTDVEIEGTAGRICLEAGVRQKCRNLFVDGERQRLGTWGAAGSGAKFTSELFEGSGVLVVYGEGGFNTCIVIR